MEKLDEFLENQANESSKFEDEDEDDDEEELDEVEDWDNNNKTINF